MNRPTTGAALFASLLALALNSCTAGEVNLVDLAGLRNSGNDWEIVHQDSSSDGGSITLHQGKWAMFFLHWRPMPEEDLSVPYVRNLLLNFWGPDMPFDVSEGGGMIDLGSKQAYYIDGTLGDNVVRTRFIVWNCPESNRQIIADCNINRAQGTPDSILEMQYDIASTISCDGSRIDHDFSALPADYVSEQFDISFSIPSNWRTHEYPDTTWFPNGQTDTNGTLWTLLTDAERLVFLSWTNNDDEISEETLRLFLSQSDMETASPDGITGSMGEITIESTESRHDYLLADGRFEYTQRFEDQEATEPYRYRAFLWEDHGRTYFLLASIVLRTELWQRPVDLTPSSETFERFLVEELLPNVPDFDRVYP